MFRPFVLFYPSFVIINRGRSLYIYFPLSNSSPRSRILGRADVEGEGHYDSSTTARRRRRHVSNYPPPHRLFPAAESPHILRGAASRRSPTWRPYSTTAPPGRCWNCGAPPPCELFLVCAACRSVQPVDDSVDFFKIFGLEREYELRVEELEGKYKDWQKKLHPDLVHMKSERERSYAAGQSTRVIQAFTTLSRPLSRAIYMLQLEGVHLEEEGTITDPDLLAEVLEIRESVEEADDLQTLEQIKSTSKEKLEIWSKTFDGAFKERRFKEAVASIRRMTYYQRAIEEIVKKL